MTSLEGAANHGARTEGCPGVSRTGLVVGKFCPLHEGHQRLIAFAQERCDRLLLISYTKPEFEGCGVAERRRWLEQLYPQTTRLVVDDNALAAFAARTGGKPRCVPPNDAPDAEHRAFTAWLCQAVLGTTVDVVFTSEDYGDGFAAALTQAFAAERATAAPVAHVCFDRERSQAPISGTQVRRDPTAHRAYLADVVAASLGASGQTTLAAASDRDGSAER
jgi:HTH-type transcriptional repressor of NAD biosynthesis genes